MSDFSAYHSLGADQQQDPNQRQNQAGGQQSRPPISSGPPGYQQTQSYGQHAPSPYNASPQPQYGGTPQYGNSPQLSYSPGPGYGPQHGDGSQDGMAGMTAQVAGLGLGHDTQSGHRKKKNRHAHHEIASSGSSQAFNGMPQGSAGQPSEFLNQNPHTGEQITAGMSQFPAPVNAPFQPGQPATQLDYAARPAAISSSAGKVDPDQIPSVPRSRDGPAEYYLEHVFPTMENHIPPPAAVPFVAFDQGNSSPKFARLTMTHIPASQEALTSVSLPLGLVLQPLAPLQEGEPEIPVLDFGDAGPPRCRRCRAYINPFMTFRSGGNKFICNMCTFPNDVVPEYFSPTDPSGVRVDRQQRPELMLGTVEFVVPKEYWGKVPVPLRWLFLIDVTEESVNRAFLEGFCEGIMNALYGDGKDDDDDDEDADDENSLPKKRLPEGVKVGIVTFDKQMHFYNLSSSLDQAQMMVMPDIEEPFVPLSEGLFVDPEESKAVITSLLSRLPVMFNPDVHVGLKQPEPALLPALNAAHQALETTGGKIVCSLAALPTWGPGRLFLRDDNSAVAGTDAEKKLLSTEHPGYVGLAKKMVEHGIGIDFFLAAPSGGYLDIATIGHVSSKTSGETYYYPNFYAPRDSLRLSKEICHTVTRPTGFQSLMKVRCSNGLQVSEYHGNFYHHTFGADLEFGVIDSDKAIAVVFSYDGKLDPKLDAHFQSALLYTTSSGQRRVRCHNLVASVAETGGEAMKFVDQDAVVSIIAKEAASRVAERSLKDVRNAITEKTVDILASYRKNFSASHPQGQLVIPENLKELSMYMLSMIKSRAFKGGREPTDRRVHDIRLIKSMGCPELSLYLYPRMISLHNLDPADGFANEQGHLHMPHTIRASFSKVEEGGVYVVDNGQILLLWLHAQVSPNLLQDLFGDQVTSLKSLDPFLNQLPILETHLNAQVRNILQWLESNRGSKVLTIQLARQGLDGSEYEFARMLCEDRNNEAQSYVDWLVHLHRHIQMDLAGQRKKEDTGDGIASTFVGLRTNYW